MDQVVLGVADKDVPIILGGVRTSSIDRCACAGIDDVVAGTRRLGRSNAIRDPTA